MSNSLQQEACCWNVCGGGQPPRQPPTDGIKGGLAGLAIAYHHEHQPTETSVFRHRRACRAHARQQVSLLCQVASPRRQQAQDTAPARLSGRRTHPVRPPRGHPRVPATTAVLCTSRRPCRVSPRPTQHARSVRTDGGAASRSGCVDGRPRYRSRSRGRRKRGRWTIRWPRTAQRGIQSRWRGRRGARAGAADAHRALAAPTHAGERTAHDVPRCVLCVGRGADGGPRAGKGGEDAGAQKERSIADAGWSEVGERATGDDLVGSEAGGVAGASGVVGRDGGDDVAGVAQTGANSVRIWE